MIADRGGWRQFHEENWSENRAIGVVGQVPVIVFGRSADFRACPLRHRVLRKLDFCGINRFCIAVVMRSRKRRAGAGRVCAGRQRGDGRSRSAGSEVVARKERWPASIRSRAVPRLQQVEQRGRRLKARKTKKWRSGHAGGFCRDRTFDPEQGRPATAGSQPSSARARAIFSARWWLPSSP